VERRPKLTSCRRWLPVAVWLALALCLAGPAFADDPDDRDDVDGGSLRHQRHRRQREQVIVPNTRSNATQPYWGTTQPYWGTMQPYWGPSGSPSQPLPNRAPLNRRAR